MDISLSGILSYIEEKAPMLIKKGEYTAGDLCYSLQVSLTFRFHARKQVLPFYKRNNNFKPEVLKA